VACSRFPDPAGRSLPACLPRLEWSFSGLAAEPAHDTTAHLLGKRGQIGLGDRTRWDEHRRSVTRRCGRGRHEDAVGHAGMQVLAACDMGRSTREVATYFDVSESWVRHIKQERRELNKTAPFLKRRRVPLWAAFADQVKDVIKRNPDLTLEELKRELGTDLSVPTLCTALQRLRLTLKKKSSSPRKGIVRTLRRDGKSRVGNSRI